MAYWALLFFFCGALFRRFLGRQVIVKGHKISRIYKLILLILTAMLMYFVAGKFPTDWKGWLCMAWAIGWLVRFNNHTHGDYWILDDTRPDEERSWWVGKVLKLIFGKGGYYKFEGNFIGLMLGYLVPAIFASITMPYHWFWLAGITAPVCYTICEMILNFTGRRTEISEYAHGALMFLLFFINIGGI